MFGSLGRSNSNTFGLGQGMAKMACYNYLWHVCGCRAGKASGRILAERKEDENNVKELDIRRIALSTTIREIALGVLS